MTQTAKINGSKGVCAPVRCSTNVDTWRECGL